MQGHSLLKFFRDTGGERLDGDKLFWPGLPSGIPFRGRQVPDLKGDEADEIPLRYDFKSEMFLLWDPEHKRRFDDIMDHIVNGLYMKMHRAGVWDDAQKHYRVQLEWVEVYGEAKGNHHGSTFPRAAG